MFAKIYKLGIFSELSQEAIANIIEVSYLKKVKPNEFFFREEDISEHLDILVSGECVAIKSHPFSNAEHIINRLVGENVIGGLGLIGSHKRVVSIKAVQECEVLCIPTKAFEKIIYNKENIYTYFPLVQKLQTSLAKWLLLMTEQRILSMEKEFKLSKERNRISLFFISLTGILSLFNLFNSKMNALVHSSSNSTPVTLSMAILLILYVIFWAKKSGMKLNEFGISLLNWRRSIINPIIYSIPIMILLTLIKYIMITHSIDYSHLPVFDIVPTKTLTLGSTRAAVIYIILESLGYIFIVVPLQEFITRGVLQGFLNKVFFGKKKHFYSISLSNLIFASVHSFISLRIAIVSFFFGIFLGWMYYKDKSLLSPSIAHALIGSWALMVLNFSVILI